jgi:hypothetical protein
VSPEINDYASLQWPWDLWNSNWWSLGNKLKTWSVKLYFFKISDIIIIDGGDNSNGDDVES